MSRRSEESNIRNREQARLRRLNESSENRQLRLEIDREQARLRRLDESSENRQLSIFKSNRHKL